MRRNRILSLALVCALALTLLSPAARAWEKKGEYSEGMVTVTDGAKWGYANASGVLAVPLRFEEADSFSLGAALVKENGRYGLLRQDGAWLLEPVYESLTAVDYGVYIGVRDGVPSLCTTVPLPAQPGEGAAWLTRAASAVYTGKAEDGTATLTIEFADGGEPQVLAVSGLPAALKSAGVPGAVFSLRNSRQAKFSDVSGRDWFDLWVDLAYNTGLMEGPGDGKFWPYRTLTVGEALKLAAVLDSRARGGTFQSGGDPWYASAVDYCQKNGLIAADTFEDYTRPITRAELALVFAATAPAKEAADLNDPIRVQTSIPDVAAADYAAGAIFSLYAKGIVSGSDKQLTFRPNAVITRSEVAAMAARMARPEQRITLWPGGTAYRSAAAE